jgi:succinate dehydrogenase/fumarate reductase cytochrome b subunit
MRWRRRGLRWSAKSVRSRLHTVTGLYLLTVIGGHVIATRGPSLLQDYHPEFAGLTFSLWWLPFLFYPYYILFGLCALYHGTNGLLLAAAAFQKPLPPKLRSGPGYWLPISAIGVLLVFGVLGLGGLLYEIPDPTNNDYARMWEGFGVSLEP